jgi:hypothetical protein
VHPPFILSFIRLLGGFHARYSIFGVLNDSKRVKCFAEDWVTTAAGKREIHRMKNEGKNHPDMANVPGRRVNVCAEAGSLLLWDSLLPHGSCINTSAEPRLTVFLGHSPASGDRKQRAEDWKAQWGGLEGSEKLTDLGAKLAGLEEWP